MVLKFSVIQAKNDQFTFVTMRGRKRLSVLFQGYRNCNVMFNIKVTNRYFDLESDQKYAKSRSESTEDFLIPNKNPNWMRYLRIGDKRCYATGWVESTRVVGCKRQAYKSVCRNPLKSRRKIRTCSYTRVTCFPNWRINWNKRNTNNIGQSGRSWENPSEVDRKRIVEDSKQEWKTCRWIKNSDSLLKVEMPRLKEKVWIQLVIWRRSQRTAAVVKRIMLWRLNVRLAGSSPRKPFDFLVWQFSVGRGPFLRNDVYCCSVSKRSKD